MKGAGIGLIIFGPLLMMGALIYQPTVSTSGLYGLSEETYNLGTLQYQALFFQAGIGAFIAGVILAATGELLAPRRPRCDPTFPVRADRASAIVCRLALRVRRSVVWGQRD